MSSNEFILDWINKELKLEIDLKDISKEFSNGYRFAELLYTLKEISLDEFNEFKNSNNSEEIKLNFKKLKSLFHDKLNLDIREEEFKNVINNDISTAGIILYKIKNSLHKKKINFLNIKISSEDPGKEDINKKVMEIMDSEKQEEIKEEEKINTNTINNRYNIERNAHLTKDLNSIESDSNEVSETKRRMQLEQKESLKTDINLNNNNIDYINKKFNLNKNNRFNTGNMLNSFSNNSNKTININKTLDAKERLLTLNNLNYNTINIKNKKLLKPLSIKLNPKNITTLPKINVLPKILPKINRDTHLEFKSSVMNSNIGSISNNSVFGKKINWVTENNQNEYEETDFNNDYGMTKIKEMKNKMNKVFDDIKRQEEMKCQLQLKREYEIKEKYQLDFINKIKNPLYKFTKSTGINLNMHSNSKYNSCSKRLEYSKELKEKTHAEELSQQIASIRQLVERNTELMNLKLKKNHQIVNNSVNQSNNLVPFNKAKYFKNLNNIDREEFNLTLSKKYNTKNSSFPFMKKTVYSIIELMEEMYEYQEENEKDIIELEDFKIFSECFINDKHKEKVIFDSEEILIKSPDNADEINNIDIDNLSLNLEEKYLIQDYINYIGIWNDEKIINKELMGYKYDIKKIQKDLPSDYEPTENEIEDVTLPKKITDNYTLGNTLLSIIDAKYSNNKDNLEISKEFLNKENNNLSKWNYIPYKLSIIGYPLSGRKFIAENLNKKYPNIKIYSIKKIFRDHYIEYKNLTEKIDDNPKYKSLKPNQIAQMKEEREKQLQEFNPILEIIKPFIDNVNEEKIKKKKEKNLAKSPNRRRGSISKKRRNSVLKEEKEEEVEEDNINDDLKIIPKDQILFNLLKYKIEKDFPKKPKEESDKEILEKQTKIFQILKNIENLEKQKKEAAKPNPKDDIALNNMQKELETIKLESIKGFILVDYPCNINQCVLLENYLTGYVDEMQRPKSEKNKLINDLSNFLDFKIMPKKNNVFKKAGLDFIINIINQEKDIDERFNSKKYDPINDKIYTNSDLNEENANKQPLDKKIVERLVNDVPYLNKDNFEFYKHEYNINISQIKSLYDKFGMYVDIENAQDNQMNILGIDISEKELQKTFQTIELETELKTKAIKKEIEIEKSTNEKEIAPASPKKEKRASIKRKSIIKNEDNKKRVFELEEINKNKILDFISNNIINWLYKEKDKSDKIIFYSNHPEYNTVEENDRIKFDPDLKINEINNDNKGKKTMKTQNVNSSGLMGESRIISLVNKNSNYVIKQLIDFNQKYHRHIGKFMYLINFQKNSIYKRLNLIQKKFRDFLNFGTNKKKVLHIYISKYNEFFRDKQYFFQSKKAIEEFSEDIEEVNNNLWILINEKEKDSIKELETIENCGFIEKELGKFYENIKELSLIEAERFIIMINSILYLYSNGNKNINLFKKEENIRSTFRNNSKTDSKVLNDLNNKNDNIFNEKGLNEIYGDKNYVLKNLLDIKFVPIETKSSFNNTKNKFEIKKGNKSLISVNNLISQISNNIEIMFNNSITLILEYHQIIEKLIKEIKSTSTMSPKKYYKKKNATSSNSSMLNSMLGGESQLNEKIIKMLQNEKNRYKYRMCFLKSFAYKYMAIIAETSQNIYENLDNWIVTSVTLQNDALNMVISILKKKLKDHRLINEKREINIIEMDEFEKKIDDNEEGGGSEIGLKPIDNSSVGIGRVYNKINIDYLINDNFIDIKIEENINKNQKEEKNVNKSKILKDDKNENKKYKMILPNELDRSINSSINNSFGGIKNRLREFDYYYDINKFNSIYKNIKKYEIQENIITKDLFNEVFIKQYLIDKYGENDTEKENINLGISNINANNKNKINKLDNELNESDEEEEDNINTINEHLLNNQSNFHNLNGICTALKLLNTKQINKIYNLYKIPIEHNTKNQPHIQKKEETTNENKKEDNEEKKDDSPKKENISKEEANDNNINNEIQIEYDQYLNTSEIFTILPLIGCRIMNLIEEEKIMDELKEKLVRGKYLLKQDFMDYQFWFEQELEYQNDELIFPKMSEQNNNINIKNNLGLSSNKKINIKEFLFNIWKDEKGEKMDFERFIGVLKSNKYITDLNGLNEENYYNVIFKNEN